MEQEPFSRTGKALRFISYIQPVGTNPTTYAQEHSCEVCLRQHQVLAGLHALAHCLLSCHCQHGQHTQFTAAMLVRLRLQRLLGHCLCMRDHLRQLNALKRQAPHLVNIHVCLILLHIHKVWPEERPALPQKAPLSNMDWGTCQISCEHLVQLNT